MAEKRALAVAQTVETVSRPSSFVAAMAETRPLIAAEPMFRAPSPEMVSESNLTSCPSAPDGGISSAKNDAAIGAKPETKRPNELLISANPSQGNCVHGSTEQPHP